jgi:hypothetical protein
MALGYPNPTLKDFFRALSFLIVGAGIIVFAIVFALWYEGLAGLSLWIAVLGVLLVLYALSLILPDKHHAPRLTREFVSAAKQLFLPYLCWASRHKTLSACALGAILIVSTASAWWTWHAPPSRYVELKLRNQERTILDTNSIRTVDWRSGSAIIVLHLHSAPSERKLRFEDSEEARRAYEEIQRACARR